MFASQPADKQVSARTGWPLERESEILNLLQLDCLLVALPASSSSGGKSSRMASVSPPPEWISDLKWKPEIKILNLIGEQV